MILLVGILIYGCNIISADVASDFKETEIVPDVLDSPPNELLEVLYDGKKVNFGEEWTPTAVKFTPTLEWNFDPGSFYTLIMTNIDPLSRKRPIYREFLHWLITNIPGNDFSQGQVIAEYAGAAPPKDEGLHRIVFTVYKQPEKLTFDEKYMKNRQLGIRLRFSQKNFSNKYNMGPPIAGNMYIAQYDDYCPILHQEFMDGYKQG